MQNNIPIFLSSDNNYAPLVTTTIASVCDNTEKFVDFYVLDGGITSENCAKIQNLKRQFKNFSLEFIKIDLEKEFASIDYKNSGKHITLSTYNRFLIPGLKPEISKAIYLDVDIIVLNDIAELYNENLGEYALGAIYEEYAENNFNQTRKQYLSLDDTHKYFNAGILLLDCDKWRKQNIAQKLFELEALNRSILRAADQDILNIHFNNNYAILPEKYNFLCNRFVEKKCTVAHFVGSKKPWHISPNINTDLMPFGKEFWKYAKMTEFYSYLLSNLGDKNQQDTLLRHLQLLKIRIKNITNKEIK